MTHPVASSRRPVERAATRPALRAAAGFGLTAALVVGGACGATAAPGHSGGAPHHGNGHSTQNAHHGQPQPEQRTAHPSSRQQPATSSGTRPTKAASDGDRTAGGSASARRTADPRGNNGTITIDGPAYDTGVDNEPHPGCAFRITFFGFDAGQTADITITGIAPTGGGLLLHDTAVPTSDDAAAGAGRDVDGATRVYTADDLGLSSMTPHPKQGYHLKVAVDSVQAPGGAKQKVLWLAPCEQQPAVAAAATASGARMLLAGMALRAGTSGSTSGSASGSASGSTSAP
ncbi:MAG TPA: hypothetical protein VHO27_17245, partial [Angustibacter sp.]|nr:hypothetical protein [Angustibacter sp.]